MTSTGKSKILALSGGVGGAKLALGLATITTDEQLTVVVNTADDFEHLGLSISPDLDTLLYTLAGESNQSQGWGLCGESWQAMNMLSSFGGETWFQLGDRDLGTHLMRTNGLHQGDSLTKVTETLRQGLKVKQRILPMSDDPVRTQVNTLDGQLSFQHYFVRERCQPKVTGFHFEGVSEAKAQAEFVALLQDPELAAVVICPSNPFVSVAPMLSLTGVKVLLQKCQAPIVAVSPIVSGMAIKGPAAKMMEELNMPCTAVAVAEYYGDLLDGFVIDDSDAIQKEDITQLGIDVLVAPTVMNNFDDKVALAKQVLTFCETLQDEAVICGQ